jgi:hypothetical protein
MERARGWARRTMASLRRMMRCLELKPSCR